MVHFNFYYCIIFAFCFSTSNELNLSQMSHIISNPILTNYILTHINDNKEIEMYTDILEPIIDLFTLFFKDIFSKAKDIIGNSSECYKSFSNLFNELDNKERRIFIEKLIDDSSKNYNDLSSYHDCMNKKYSKNNSQNSSYLVVLVNETEKANFWEFNKTYSSFDYGQGSFLFGLCVPEFCNLNEYDIILNLSYISLKRMIDPYSLIINLNIIAQMNFSDYNISTKDFLGKINYAKLIPLYYLIIHLIVVLFTIMPFCLWKYFFKNKQIELGGSSIVEDKKELSAQTIEADLKLDNPLLGNDDRKSKISRNLFDQIYNKKAFSQFKSSIPVSRNFEELLNYTVTTSELNNDSGLTYIRGLKGISIIFLFFGNAYIALFNSQVTVYGKINFLEVMSHYLFFIFYIGVRYAPRVLFSCSGYSLFYKMMNYLDNSYDDILEEKKDYPPETNNEDDANDKSNNNISKDKSNDTSIDYATKSNDSLDIIPKGTFPKKRKIGDIPFSLLFKFYSYQIHKYFFYIILILFFQFSLYDLLKILTWNNAGVMWEYFKNVVQLDWKQLLYGIFLIYPFLFKNASNHVFLNYMWQIQNEFIFFILTSFIIFLGYKYKKKINLIFTGLIFVIVILNYGFFIAGTLIRESENKKNCIPLQFYTRTSWYYYFFDFGNYLTHPFFNYVYFLIGVFFGSLNYVIQKGMTSLEVDNEEKPFLFSSIKFVKWYKTFTKKSLSIGAIILIIILYIMSNYQTLFLLIRKLIYKDEFLDNFEYTFDEGPLTYLHGIYFLFDIPFAVLIVNIITFGLYIKGTNSINDFLCHPFWSVFSKLYYSFILTAYPIILYILLQSDARITFNLSTCLLYSCITFFFTLLVSIIVYAFFEMPFKRIIKMIFNNPYMEQETDFGYSMMQRSKEFCKISHNPLFFPNALKEKDS